MDAVIYALAQEVLKKANIDAVGFDYYELPPVTIGEYKYYLMCAPGNGKLYFLYGESSKGTLYELDLETRVWSQVASPTVSGREWSVEDFVHIGNNLIMLASGDRKPEIYDANSNVWSSAADLSAYNRDSAIGSRKDGTLLMAGGRSEASGYTVTSAVRMYDRSANAWSSRASMVGYGAEVTGVFTQDGLFYAFGGRAGLSSYSSSDIRYYDPVANVWTEHFTTFPEKRFQLRSTVLSNGKILLIGGRIGSGTSTEDVPTGWVFDPSSGTITHYSVEIQTGNYKGCCPNEADPSEVFVFDYVDRLYKLTTDPMAKIKAAIETIQAVVAIR